jgi:hypothetical protein
MERQEGFICCEHLRPCLKDVPAETILCTCPWHTQHKLLWCNSTGTLYHDGNLVAPKYDQVPHYWNIKGAHTNRTLRTVAAIHDLPQNVKGESPGGCSCTSCLGTCTACLEQM